MDSFFATFLGNVFRFDCLDVRVLGRRTTVTSFPSSDAVDALLKNDPKAFLNTLVFVDPS